MNKAWLVAAFLLVLPIVFAAEDVLAQEAIKQCNELFKVDCSTFQSLFYQFIIPFAGVWLITSAYIIELGILRSRGVAVLIGMLAGLGLFYSGGMSLIITQLFQTMGVWTVAMFAFLVLSGTAMMTLNKFTGLAGVITSGGAPLKGQITRQKEYLLRLQNRYTQTQSIELMKEIRAIEGDIRDMESRLAFFEFEAAQQLTPKQRMMILLGHAFAAGSLGVVFVVIIGPLITPFLGGDQSMGTLVAIGVVGIASYLVWQCWKMYRARSGQLGPENPKFGSVGI